MDRWRGRGKEREKERNEKERERPPRLLVLHSHLRLLSHGGGGTNDSDSCAKSYSFGPSTTWPRHNRVKVASRLSPRGGFRSAREVSTFFRRGREKEREKKKTLNSSGVKVGGTVENKDKLTVPGWMERRIHFGADCAARRIATVRVR